MVVCVCVRVCVCVADGSLGAGRCPGCGASSPVVSVNESSRYELTGTALELEGWLGHRTNQEPVSTRSGNALNLLCSVYGYYSVIL